MKISRKASFILFFSFSFPALGQKNICGHILDSLSLRPVSYATVSTLSTSMYCDSLGYFKLNNIQDNYIIISCIGYNNKKINIKRHIQAKHKSKNKLKTGNFNYKYIDLQKYSNLNI
jgi:hypothetical protein